MDAGAVDHRPPVEGRDDHRGRPVLPRQGPQAAHAARAPAADLGLRVRPAGGRGRRPPGRRALDAARPRVHTGGDRGLPRRAAAGRGDGEIVFQALFSWAETDEAAFEAARKWKGAQPEDHYTRDWHKPQEMYEHGEREMSDEEFAQNAIVGSDPPHHVERLRELEELGATVIVLQNNSGADPLRAIEVYGEQRAPSAAGRARLTSRVQRRADGAAPLAASRRRGARGRRDPARPARRGSPGHQPRLLARAPRSARAPAGGGHRGVPARGLRARRPRPAARALAPTTTRSTRASCSAPTVERLIADERVDLLISPDRDDAHHAPQDGRGGRAHGGRAVVDVGPVARPRAPDDLLPVRRPPAGGAPARARRPPRRGRPQRLPRPPARPRDLPRASSGPSGCSGSAPSGARRSPTRSCWPTAGPRACSTWNTP